MPRFILRQIVIEPRQEMTDPLSGVRAKLARAGEHLDALGDAERRWSESKPYVVGVEFHPELGDASVVNYFARVTSVEPVPAQIPVLIGDALFNIRSTLDHLAWQLVVAHGGSPNRRTTFPIWDDRLHPSGEAKPAPTIDGGAHPDADAMIERMQPYHRTDDPTLHSLWILNELNNIDKHRLLLVLGSAYEASRVNWFGLRRTDRVDMTERIPLEPGAHLSSLGMSPARASKIGSNMQVEADLSLRIVFAEAEPARGEAITEVLSELKRFVESVVLTLSSYLVPPKV